ncbi:NHS-like protein 1 isoform X3 [Triplophysa dalaica]|uniref:NHS-like protein 1 isoform X3 n=1 Tax=Triplophysa dalaica TaxID=1582913 RepID=UPI0024E0147E|nr:NHS-like protein 1 isoform X3 [Triplophysa dalaica]
MPFYKRIVKSRRLCRFSKEGLEVDAGACGVFNRDVFPSLDDVNCKALINILHQLSDLSHHACSVFQELQTEATAVVNKASALQYRLNALQETVEDLNHKRIKIPVSSLDEESKWSVHYTAPWHQQENVFLPGSRPNCVEDLHRQAKVNLKTVLRECDKLRKDGFQSSQNYSQSPEFSSSSLCESVHLDEEKTEKKNKGSESLSEEEKLVYSMPPQTPLLEHAYDMNIQNSWTNCLPLPTPEEKMRLQAQTVAADFIPINITANKEPDDSRIQSLGMADQYSSLCRAGSVNSTLRCLDTRDFCCQTEEMKIVPPSVRRIRAQRGHGIAAQMANVSPSSSSSISTISDCNSISYTQLNGCDQSFHSLPRQGARISHQHCELQNSSTPYRVNSGSTSSLPYQLDMQHDSSASLHMLPDSKRNTLNGPKSGAFQNDHLNASPSFPGSGQISSLTLFSLSDASQKYALSGQDIQLPYSSAELFGSADASSAVSSCYDSTTSLCTGISTETESQCSTLDGRNHSHNCVRRDSNVSESSNQSCSTLTTDQWTYEVPPKDQLTSSCSSPLSHIYNSQEHSPSKTDTSSLLSMDNDGYYTSTHLDSCLKSQSHGCINKAANARHSMYECKDHHSQGDSTSLHSNRSLTRSISLRKAKRPPLPPARTDSLRRKPQRKPHHTGSVLSEQLISSLQQSLELNLQTHSASLSGQDPCSGFEDPWVLRPRSQSTVSATSSGMSAPAAVCPVTPTHSDSSSQPSDYAESWDFYMDYPGPRSEQGLSSQMMRSAGSEKNPGVMSNGSYNNGFPSAHCNDNGIKLKPVSSPDKVHRLTSPSSGYSSQSNTPTAGTPVTSLLRAKSPAGRPKPKVPERKSSLLSSVSSSSTSLSSNTSDSIKNIPPPPPLPDITSQCVTPGPTSNSLTATTKDSTPPPLPDVSSASEENSTSHSSPPEMCESLLNDCLDFITPPPKVSETLSLNDGTINSPHLSPKPSSCIPTPPPPPPPPPLPKGLQTAAICKTETSCTSSKCKSTVPVEMEKGLDHTEDSQRPRRPKITAQALQMVHLRPIKLKHIESVFTAVSVKRFNGQAQHDSQTHSGKSLKKETAEQTVTAICEAENPVKISLCETVIYSSVNKCMQNLPEASSCSLTPGPDYHVNNTKTCQNVPTPMEFPEPFSTSCDLTFHEIQQCTNSSPTPQSTPLKKKPPISPMKPNLSLIIPPNNNVSVSKGLQLQQAQETEVTPEPYQVNGTFSTNINHLQEIPLELEAEEESDSGSSTPVVKSRLSLSSELSSNSLQDLELSNPMMHDHEFELNDLELSDDKSTSDDGSSSSSGSLSFKEEENEDNGAGFDSSVESSSGENTKEVSVEEMVTPVRTRTTEDLFAAIHRSKRKVLGRGDSEEDRSRNITPSPPITPTGSCPSLPSLPRQTSSIQRNLRRSSTSNDSFKALLLKKGSRSESSFRMSASEILKCTDPRVQRAPESPQSDGLCTSPTRTRRAAEEWARTEGTLHRLSTGQTCLKYGRSRTPPSAASSRYNTRSHIPNRPMTAISEREGEVAESQDCCIGFNSSFTLPLSSSGTVCAQRST